MRRPLLLLATTLASIPLLGGAALAAAPATRAVAAPKAPAPLSTPALTIAAITKNMNAGNGAAMLALLCTADRRAMLLLLEAADIADAAYFISRIMSSSVSITSKVGVSPMGINLNFTDRLHRLDGPIVSPYALLLQNGRWCLSGDGKEATDLGDSLRSLDSWLAQDAQERFILTHPRSSGVALTVDATRRATTVYLGSTGASFPVSKGTRLTVRTHPATASTVAGFCVTTVNIGSNDPTLAETYDSRQGMAQSGAPC